MDDQKIMQQSPYLRMMGIQQWVRRDSDSSDLSRYFEDNGISDSPLLVITTVLNGEEETLLKNMLRAIDLESAKVQRIMILEPAHLSQHQFQKYLVDLIGNSSVQAVLQLGGDAINHPLVESTFHPSHLLQHSGDKRHAWKVLKQVKQKING